MRDWVRLSPSTEAWALYDNACTHLSGVEELRYPHRNDYCVDRPDPEKGRKLLQQSADMGYKAAQIRLERLKNNIMKGSLEFDESWEEEMKFLNEEAKEQGRVIDKCLLDKCLESLTELEGKEKGNERR